MSLSEDNSSASSSDITYISGDSSLGQSYDYLFKVLLVGNSGTGKSSIVEQFTERTFHAGFVSTIGVDFKIVTLKYKNKIVKLQIWDTAGQERFRSITASYYRGSNAIMVVYDVTEPVTLKEAVTTWITEIEKYAIENAKLLFVGNKADLASQYEDKVAETKMLLANYKAQSPEQISETIFTSAKTGENVEAAFVQLIDILMVEQVGNGRMNNMNGGGIDNTRLGRGRGIKVSTMQEEKTDTGGGCC